MSTDSDTKPTGIMSGAHACSDTDLARAIEHAKRITASGASDDGTLLSRALITSRAEIANLTAVLDLSTEALRISAEEIAENKRAFEDAEATKVIVTSLQSVLAETRASLVGALARGGSAVTEEGPPCPGDGWEWDAFALQWFQPGATGKAIGRAF